MTYHARLKLFTSCLSAISFVVLSTLLAVSCQPTVQKVDYFGQQEPGLIPEVFASGIISLEDR